MSYLLALIGVLFGSVLALLVKKRSAEALLENNEVKSKLNEQDKNIAANDGRLESEESKRTDLLKNAEDKKKEPVKSDDF